MSTASGGSSAKLAAMLRGISPEVALRVLLLCVFAGVALYYLLEREQSFTLHVQTKSARIELTDADPAPWYVAGATLCQRAEGGGDGEGTLCDLKYYNSHQSEEAEVLWQTGVVLTISGMDETYLSAHITVPEGASRTSTFDTAEITDQSVLVFERQSLEDTASLVAAGHLVIGEVAETGSTQLLQGGVYEIRESLKLSSGPSVVARGSFLPGDSISLLDKSGDPVPAQILITAPLGPRSDFELVATSPPRNSAMVVQRIGAVKTQITSRWMDRLVNDALPLALSIFLGLLGASLGIAKNVVSVGTLKRWKGDT